MTNSSIIRYLTHFRHYYPEILDWYSRVEAGIASGHRSVFVLWNGSDVEGLAVTKNGYKAKLCHISVSPKVRKRGVGQSMMRLAVHDMADRGAREIRVTTDEQVFRDHGSFFLVGGFEVIDWQVNRYRRGTSELLWRMKVNSDSWEVRDSNQTWNDPATLALANLAWPGDRIHPQHFAPLTLTRLQSPLQENIAKALRDLRTDGLDTDVYNSLLQEVLRMNRHSLSAPTRSFVPTKNLLWKTINEVLYEKVRRWKYSLTDGALATRPLASEQRPSSR